MTIRTSTPKEATVIRQAITRAIGDAHVAMPARVEKYTAGTATTRPLIDVQPSLKGAMPGDASASNMPIIHNVPVVYQSTAEFCVAYPLKKGDCVLLVFSDRSLDAWLSGTKSDPVDPQDTRQHALTDAIAIPGFFQDYVPLADAVNDADFRMSYNRNGVVSAVRIVAATGDVVIENGTGQYIMLGAQTGLTDGPAKAGALYNWLNADLLTTYIGGLITALTSVVGALVEPTGAAPGTKAAFKAAMSALATALIDVKLNYGANPPPPAPNVTGKGVTCAKVKI
jgi:hypothetical protein